MATVAQVYPRFSFGKTISDTFSVVGGNFGTLVALCFLFSALPALIFNYFYLSAMMGMGTNPANFDLGDVTGIFGTALIGGVLLWVLYCLLQIAIIRTALLHFRGERARLGDSITFALGKLVPVLGVSFLGWALIAVLAFVVIMIFAVVLAAGFGGNPGVGAVLAVILLLPLMMAPIFFLMVVFIAQVPAYVAEPIGVFETFARSWALTRGSRWKIFALCLLYLIAIYIVFIMFMGIGMALGMSTMNAFDPTSGGIPAAGMLIPTIIMQTISSMIAALFGLPGLASIYANLRESKEGINQDRIADVFG